MYTQILCSAVTLITVSEFNDQPRWERPTFVDMISIDQVCESLHDPTVLIKLQSYVHHSILSVLNELNSCFVFDCSIRTNVKIRPLGLYKMFHLNFLLMKYVRRYKVVVISSTFIPLSYSHNCIHKHIIPENTFVAVSF